MPGIWTDAPPRRDSNSSSEAPSGLRHLPPPPPFRSFWSPPSLSLTRDEAQRNVALTYLCCGWQAKVALAHDPVRPCRPSREGGSPCWPHPGPPGREQGRPESTASMGGLGSPPSLCWRAQGCEILASVGLEPTTFALLARRSNRLS